MFIVKCDKCNKEKEISGMDYLFLKNPLISADMTPLSDEIKKPKYMITELNEKKMIYLCEECTDNFTEQLNSKKI